MRIRTKPNLIRRSTAALIDYGIYLAFFAWLVGTYGVPNDEGGYSLNNDLSGLVAVITIKNTPDHQRIGDLWAKTIVVGSDNALCLNCKEHLTISADEVIKGEFVCPACKSVNRRDRAYSAS